MSSRGLVAHIKNLYILDHPVRVPTLHIFRTDEFPFCGVMLVTLAGQTIHTGGMLCITNVQ